MLGILVSTIKEGFASKLSQVLPLIENQLHDGSFGGPGKYVRAPSTCIDAEDIAEKDHLLFQALQLYKTVTEVCPDVLTDSQYTEHINRIGGKEIILFGKAQKWKYFTFLFFSHCRRVSDFIETFSRMGSSRCCSSAWYNFQINRRR